MNNLNSILLEGFLVRDPLEKEIEGKALSSFSIGCNRYYKRDNVQTQETSFFNVDVWGKTAEYCNKYLKKGSGVRVVGRLKQEKWQDAEDKNHSTVKIIAEHVDFFPSRNSGKKVAEHVAVSENTTSANDRSSTDAIPSEETVPIE